MMSKANKEFVPKLRFPEFKECGAWEEKRLGEVADIKTGSSNRQDSTSSGGQYVFFDRSQDIRTSSNFLFDAEAIIIGGEGQKFKPKYFLGKFDLHQRAYATMNFQTNSGLFLYYYIDCCGDAYFQSQAVGSTVKSLRLPMFQAMPISIPPLAEQQKIADCLSSIDDVIQAESDYLETLKKHKKALMQKLFPREGETTPEHRFPEFRNGEAWEEKMLGEIGEIITGNTPPKSDPNNYGKTYNWATAKDFKQKYISNTEVKLSEQGKQFSRFLPKGSVLVTCIASIGKNAIANEPLATNQQINSIIVHENNSNEFIYYLITCNKNKLLNCSGMTAVPIISRYEFSNLNFFVPPLAEQQKIADCLSSLDDLISAQSDKIEALKEHKKGLMQQLFPSFDEVA